MGLLNAIIRKAVIMIMEEEQLKKFVDVVIIVKDKAIVHYLLL